MSTIHQRLRDEHGLARASRASAVTWRRTSRRRPAGRRSRCGARGRLRPGSRRRSTTGMLGRWLDPATGKLRTVWAFVMVLACSRHMFVRPVLKMDQRAWTECHVEAFAFFGGVPARLVPDNLKTGVDKPDLYDPKVNRSYAELAAHYGCLVDPARALKPRDKARVERPMPYVRDSFWRGREFTSLERMQAEAARWSAEVAGGGSAGRWRAPPRPRCSRRWRRTRCGRCRPGRSCWPRGRRRRSARTSTPRSTRSSTRCPGGTSARPPTSGSPARMVQFFIGGQLVKSHPRKIRGKQTDFGDYPPEKIAFHMRTPAMVPQAGRRHRPGLRAADRRAARRQRPLPAPRRPGRHRPGRQARSRQARGRLREGDHGRRPVLPHRPGHPRRRRRAGPAARRGRGRRGGGVPARPGLVRERHPHARHDPQRRRHPGDHEGSTVMTTAVTVTDRSALASALRDLKLSGMLATLDARLAQAGAGELGHLDFLQVLCQDEISRRQSMSLTRRIRRARFETEATLEGFDFTASPKLPAAQIRDLAALRWLQSRRVGHPLRPGRRRQEPRRPGPRPPRRPGRGRGTVHSKPAASWPTSPGDGPTAPGTNGSPSSPAPPSWSWTTSACASSPPRRPTTSTS